MAGFKHRLREQNRSDGSEGGSGGRTPAEVNASQNRQRLNRIEEIGRGADGRRAAEMVDVDGERASGAFAGGEFDDSPEARERLAEQEDAEAQARLEQEQDEARARALQTEDAGQTGEDDDASSARRGNESRGSDDPDRRGGAESEEGDEKTIDGIRYYATEVNGELKWLTLKELRTRATQAGDVESTLQRAQDALQRASQAPPTPKEGEAEISDADLENVVLSAGMGDEEAVRKLVSVLKAPRNGGLDLKEISRQVTQQIATQREVDRGEEAVKDLLSHPRLSRVFRQELSVFASEKPKTKITDAYRIVGEQVRKDFASMLAQGGRPLPTDKLGRKRTIVNPPAGAGRQPRREEEDREVPMSEQIDAMARQRGQQRAHRVRRS